MGKIPPSLRGANLDVAFRRPPRHARLQSQPPHRPPFPSKKPKPKKPQPQAPTAPPPLPAFLTPSLPAAIAAFDSLLSSPHPLPHPHHLLHSFTLASPSPADTLSFFRHISPHFPSPDRRTFLPLLSHTSSHPDVSPESYHPILSVLSSMSAAGFPPDASTADLTVRALCSAGNHDTAATLLLDPASPLRPDLYTYNYLIRRLARHRPLNAVKRFIKHLRSHPTAPIQPDVVTYTILIDVVCRDGNLREATRLLSVLREAGFKPDTYLYNTIMKGYCTLDQGGEVMEVYSQMMEEGVEADLVTYNTLVYGLAKDGRIDKAREFLEKMAEMGYFPDVVTYTSLMNGMCRKGEAVKALRLLGEMERRGCSPNDCTYNTLLTGLFKNSALEKEMDVCKTHALDRGMELYATMKSGGMKLEKSTYETVVRVLCRAGRIADAYDVFDYARESQSLSEVAAYTALESSLRWLKNAKDRVF